MSTAACRADGRRQVAAATAVFVSRSPQVLTAWHAADSALTAYTARIRDILKAAQAGGFDAAFTGGGEFAGLVPGPDGVLLPGWCRRGALAVPDLRLAAGRWVAAAVARAQYPGDPRCCLPGLPQRTVSALGRTDCRVELLENGAALYIRWPWNSRNQARDGHPDLQLWQPVPQAALAPRQAPGR